MALAVKGRESIHSHRFHPPLTASAESREKSPLPGVFGCGDSTRTQHWLTSRRTVFLGGTVNRVGSSASATPLDQKQAKLTDVKLKEAELTFSAVRVVMENKILIDYKFTITGDTSPLRFP